MQFRIPMMESAILWPVILWRMYERSSAIQGQQGSFQPHLVKAAGCQCCVYFEFEKTERLDIIIFRLRSVAVVGIWELLGRG